MLPFFFLMVACYVMNRLRWEQNASIPYMYKYLHSSDMGFLSPRKRERLKGNIIKSTLGRHEESESRWAWRWAKQRRESGLPRETMNALLLWPAKNTVIFPDKNTVFRFGKSKWVHAVITGRRLNRLVWHQALHFLLPEDGGTGLPVQGVWPYKMNFTR